MKEPMATASTPPTVQNSRDQDRRVAGDEKLVFIVGPSKVEERRDCLGPIQGTSFSGPKKTKILTTPRTGSA